MSLYRQLFAVYFHLASSGLEGFPLGHVKNYSYNFEEPVCARLNPSDQALVHIKLPPSSLLPPPSSLLPPPSSLPPTHLLLKSPRFDPPPAFPSSFPVVYFLICLQALYLFIFVLFAFNGAGPFSVNVNARSVHVLMLRHRSSRLINKKYNDTHIE